MKPFCLIITILGIMFLIFYSCGTKWTYRDYWFINKTGHKIDVETYLFGKIDSRMSFTIAPNDSTKEISFGHGDAGTPFTSNYPIDSLLLVFDDTLSLNTWIHREFAPVVYEIISENKRRYVFTEAHYQKALEVNGFLK